MVVFYTERCLLLIHWTSRLLPMVAGHCCHISCLTTYVRFCSEDLRHARAVTGQLSFLVTMHNYNYLCLACGLSPRTSKDGKTPQGRPADGEEIRSLAAGFVHLKMNMAPSNLGTSPSHAVSCGKACFEHKMNLQKQLSRALAEIAVLRKHVPGFENSTNSVMRCLR